MVKLICFLHRREGLSRAEFHQHWRERHGPLIAGIPELARHVLRYEQNHRLPDPPDDTQADSSDKFDGCTVMEYESMAAYFAFANEPLYAERIAPDEAQFMDRARTLYFFTDAAEEKIGGDLEQAKAQVKLMALLKRKKGLSAEAFHSHWSGPHAALFSETPALRETILAYQQNHRGADDYTRDPATEWDGVAEQWYTSMETFLAGAGGPPFEEVILPDEHRFLDRAATRFILCEPPVVILDRAERGS